MVIRACMKLKTKEVDASGRAGKRKERNGTGATDEKEVGKRQNV